MVEDAISNTKYGMFYTGTNLTCESIVIVEVYPVSPKLYMKRKYEQ